MDDDTADNPTLKIETKAPNDDDLDIEVTVKESDKRLAKTFRRSKVQDNIQTYTIEYKQITTAAYFPAFRSMIEAWISVK